MANKTVENLNVSGKGQAMFFKAKSIYAVLTVTSLLISLTACKESGGSKTVDNNTPDIPQEFEAEYEKAYASILSDSSLQPGNIIYGPESFSSVDFKSTRYDRTLTLPVGQEGKYKLKILNGTYGPLLAKQCALLSVVEEKRQCLYDNLVEGVTKEITRVDKSYFTLNTKKLLGGVVFDKSKSYTEIPITLNNDNQLSVDVLGYPSADVTLSIEEYNTLDNAPRALFTVSSLSGYSPLKIVFNGIHSFDSDGDPLTYTWDFGDGVTAVGVKPTHIYTQAGTYNAVLTVEDNHGNQNQISTQIVAKVKPTTTITNKKPILKFEVSYPDPIQRRKVFVSLAGSSDPDGVIAKSEINFGDGTKVQANQAEHTYAADGTYLITAKVTDDDNGATSATKSVDVTSVEELVPDGTIFGPKTYYGSFKSIDKYIENFNLSPEDAQADYMIRVKNADGQAHPITTCTGTLLQKLPCMYQNTINRAYNKLYRVDVAHVYINGKRVTDGVSINKNKFYFETVVKLKEVNKLETRLRGWPSAYIEVSIDRLRPVVDQSAPVITANISSGTLTNRAQVLVHVEDQHSTQTHIKLNGTEILNSNFKDISFNITEGVNQIEINSQDSYNNHSSPFLLDDVTLDTQAPVLSNLTPLNAKKYNVSAFPYYILFTGESNKPLGSASIEIDGNTFEGTVSEDKLSYTINAAVFREAILNYNIKVIDLAGNQTVSSKSIEVLLDRSAPRIITLSQAGSVNQSPFTIHVQVQDDNETRTTFWINDNVGYQDVTTKDIYATFNLSEGPNTIRYQATDINGNTSEMVTFGPFDLDTTPPQLSMTPNNGEKIPSLSFSITGNSNEKLRSLVLNNNEVTLDEDGKSFSGTYTVTREGDEVLHWVATDLAGNVTEVSPTVNIELNLINANLISVEPAEGNHLKVIGAPGATYPGVPLLITSGLNANFTSTTSESDGSFIAVMEVFTIATVRATSIFSARFQTAQIKYNYDTHLSGTVKDVEDNPIKGVSVSIAGSTSAPVLTDGSGVFTIPNPPTGDQSLILDGSNVPDAITGTLKAFPVTKVSVSIGVTQNNVIARPIYLTPLLFDGTETDIEPGVSATVISPHAPGVQIDIPADQAVFPGSIASINMMTVPADKSTMQLPNYLKPPTVVSLEPSGLKFNTSVALTLPNTDELPAGTPLVIMSLNSKKGLWEINGTAKVTDDGNSVKTVPGDGITHFSQVFAVPIMPVIESTGKAGNIGADTFNGSLSASIELPSFKSLGQTMMPSLHYKSAWAKPTILVSNYLDIPNQQVSLSGMYRDAQLHTYNVCDIFGCNPRVKYVEYFNNYYTDVYTAQYTPEKVTARFTMDKLSGSPVSFSGAINKSMISYAFDAIDPSTNKYYKSGVYSSLAHYDFKLKQTTIATRTVTSYSTHRRDPVVYQTTGTPETRDIEGLFPQDIVTEVPLVNYTESSAGLGWKLGGYQQIFDNGSRILISDESGGMSVYSLNNTIETLFDANSNNVDLTQTSGIQFPNLLVFESGNDQSNLVNINLNNSVKSNLLNILPEKAKLGVKSCDLESVQAISNPGLPTNRYNYHTHYKISDLIKNRKFTAVVKDINSSNYFAIDKNSHSLILVGSSGSEKILGVQSTPSASVSEMGSIENLQGWCQSTFDANCPVTVGCNYNYYNGGYCADYLRNNLPAPYNTYTSYYNLTQEISIENGVLKINYISSDGDRICTNIPDSAMSRFSIGISDSSTSGLNAPLGMTLDLSGKIVIADTGNNVVKFVDPSLPGNSTIIAGNGQIFDNGDGGPATQASLFHPRGIVYDSVGNLYISTENGFIRKVDVNGNISTFAGRRQADGGIFANQAPASDFIFVNPYGMTLDELNGYLYVADTGSHRVVQVNLQDGMANVVAGNGSCDQNKLPQATAALNASLCSPTQIGLDSNKNLIINDSGHGLIRKLSFNANAAGTLTYSPANKDLSTLTKNLDGSWIRKYRNGTIINYNSKGLEISASDRTGKAVTYNYNSDDNLISIVDPLGKSVVYNYSGGKLSNIIDPAGRTTSFNYSGDKLIKVTFPDNSTKQFSYDSSGLMTSETSQRGLTTEYEYNEWNRLQKVIKPDQSHVTVNDSGSATITNDFIGGNVGQVKSLSTNAGQAYEGIKDAKEVETKFVKDVQGFVMIVEDARGQRTQIIRDTDGRPKKIIRPDHTEMHFTYNAVTHDLIKQEDTASNSVTEYSYDLYGNLLQKKNPRGFVSSIQYDNVTGLPLVQIAANGSSQVITYNGLGLPIAVTSTNSNQSQSQTTQVQYDGAGNAVQIIDSLGLTINKSFDAAGNVVQISKQMNANDLAITNYTYD